MKARIKIHFMANWINGERFEAALSHLDHPPHEKNVGEIEFFFPHNCAMMIDAAIRLLSLANQLGSKRKKVVLNFEEGYSGTMGYLDRMGFFDHLDKRVDVVPDRPVISGALIYQGGSSNLLEIESINPKVQEGALPSRLVGILEANLDRADKSSLGQAAYTLFAELVGNIFRHSSTELDGYASLQVYRRGNGIKVAVSDSGKGILQTLRPALGEYYPELVNLSDLELMVEAFTNGLSRFGSGNGCGLRQCARHAIKFGANLEVRLPTTRVFLIPSPDGYMASTAYCYQNLPKIWGTHVCFDFKLDT